MREKLKHDYYLHFCLLCGKDRTENSYLCADCKRGHDITKKRFGDLFAKETTLSLIIGRLVEDDHPESSLAWQLYKFLSDFGLVKE